MLRRIRRGIRSPCTCWWCCSTPWPACSRPGACPAHGRRTRPPRSTGGTYAGSARSCHTWRSRSTGIDEITPAIIKRWRLSQPDTLAGRNAVTYVSRLLKGDERLSAGPVAEELARRGKPARSRLQSYPEAEFSQITTAARRMFRAAVLRIEENAAPLQRFRDGQFAAGSRDFVIGEALECLARTGDLPKYDAPVGAGKVVAQYARALGGTRAEATSLAAAVLVPARGGGAGRAAAGRVRLEPVGDQPAGGAAECYRRRRRLERPPDHPGACGYALRPRHRGGSVPGDGPADRVAHQEHRPLPAGPGSPAAGRAVPVRRSKPGRGRLGPAIRPGRIT